MQQGLLQVQEIGHFSPPGSFTARHFLEVLLLWPPSPHTLFIDWKTPSSSTIPILFCKQHNLQLKASSVGNMRWSFFRHFLMRSMIRVKNLVNKVSLMHRLGSRLPFRTKIIVLIGCLFLLSLHLYINIKWDLSGNI